MARYRFILLAVALIGVSVVAWSLRPSPPQASLSGESGLVASRGETVDVPIYIDTAGQAINAAEVYLKFNPKQFEITEVSKEGSIFQLWIPDQPSFSNDKGNISFAGGLPNPGFQGKGQIGMVRIKGKSAGSFKITFEGQTQALLNDGQGTAISLQTEPISVRVK